MKAHVATEGEACVPTTVQGLGEGEWEALHDLGVSLTEMDIVSTMSLETAVWAIQQMELHLSDFKAPPESMTLTEIASIISRLRILCVSTLVTLGVLGDLPTGENGKPEPVGLPSLGFADQKDTLRRLTKERESRGRD